MHNLIRQPLTWMVIAECVVVALLIIVVWNVVAAAAVQHAAAAPAQAIDSPAAPSDSSLPDVSVGAGSARQIQLPGLNMDAQFWRVRLSQLNRDQVFFEQLEWRIVRNAMDAAQGYLETVVLPSITRAERA
jgi:predicted secreted protein